MPKVKQPSQVAALTPTTMAVVGVSPSIANLSFTEANKHRKFKLRHSQSGADYVFRVYKASRGYTVKLLRSNKVIQSSRALSEYEISLVVGALARDHIADRAKKFEKTPFDW